MKASNAAAADANAAVHVRPVQQVGLARVRLSRRIADRDHEGRRHRACRLQRRRRGRGDVIAGVQGVDGRQPARRPSRADWRRHLDHEVAPDVGRMQHEAVARERIGGPNSRGRRERGKGDPGASLPAVHQESVAVAKTMRPSLH